ncbi:hypothetical protein BSR42_01995 [Megasphaera cerevisiae]|nr:hypothetical protein BSR42_01995 [Megasphaera cerevisiae]
MYADRFVPVPVCGRHKWGPWYIKYVVGRLPLQNIHSVTMHNIPPGIIGLYWTWLDTCCIIFLGIGYLALEPLGTAYRSHSRSVDSHSIQ